ncbi:hypothetical protein ES703_106572 [subsurface metagenome]
MMGRKSKIIILYLMFILLAAFVMVFQYGLIERAANFDDMKYRRVLTRSAFNCLKQSFKDIPALVDAVVESYETDNLTETPLIWERWKREAEHPQIISHMYILNHLNEKQQICLLKIICSAC